MARASCDCTRYIYGSTSYSTVRAELHLFPRPFLPGYWLFQSSRRHQARRSAVRRVWEDVVPSCSFVHPCTSQDLEDASWLWQVRFDLRLCILCQSRSAHQWNSWIICRTSSLGSVSRRRPSRFWMRSRCKVSQDAWIFQSEYCPEEDLTPVLQDQPNMPSFRHWAIAKLDAWYQTWLLWDATQSPFRFLVCLWVFEAAGIHALCQWILLRRGPAIRGMVHQTLGRNSRLEYRRALAGILYEPFLSVESRSCNCIEQDYVFAKRRLPSKNTSLLFIFYHPVAVVHFHMLRPVRGFLSVAAPRPNLKACADCQKTSPRSYVKAYIQHDSVT